MKNVIIVHGCSGSPQGVFDPNAQDPKSHWIPWIREAVIARGMGAVTPRMPQPWAPIYEQWRAVFEKQMITEETVLIGHSCGCAFLVRWLGDSKQKIAKCILVAPWKIGGSNEEKKLFYKYNIDETIKERVNEIIFFTADNEGENGKKSLQIFHDHLGGKIIELSGRGHYTPDDMDTQEFPELLREITK